MINQPKFILYFKRRMVKNKNRHEFIRFKNISPENKILYLKLNN